MGQNRIKSIKEYKYSTKEDLERYNRQMLLKDWNQEKLLNSTVFIAGIGALGTIIALNLAMMGVGHLILCDFDTVELSNLARQVLFEEEDIGKAKVLAAKNALKRINPTIKITTYNKKLETLERKIFEECDVIADGLDTFEARRWLNSLCVTLNKPLVHGGMYGWMGNVQVVIPFKTPCLECHPLIPQQRLQKPCTPPGEARREERKEEEGEKEKIPTIATVSTVIAGIQSQEIIKILLSSDEILEGFLSYDGRSESLTKVPLVQNPNCIICGEYRLKGTDFAIDEKDTIRAIKNRLIMTWGLQEPIRVVIRGVIQEDTVKIQDLHIKENEPIFVWDKLLSKPLKLYAVFKAKKVSPILMIPKKEEEKKGVKWSSMKELVVDKGKVTYHKNLLKIQAIDKGQEIRFFKTLHLTKIKRKIRYKIKES